MANKVNVRTSNWRATGANVSVPQYRMTIQVDWIDEAGASQSQSATVNFPNVLSQVPTEWLADDLQELLVKYYLKYIGVTP